MNYELAICFLFILLFIVYFYIRKQPILEGAGKKKKSDPVTKFFKDAEKQTKKGFEKAKKETQKGFEKAKKETQKGFDKIKNSILGPILKWVKQLMNFFKNLGRLFTDWVKFINGNIMCGIRNVSNPICLLWNVIRLIGLIFYGLVWLIILIFGGQSMANSFECIIIKIEDFLWKFRPKILDTCSKGCSAEIPIWGGKKMRSPADKAKSKCKAKPTAKIDVDNLMSIRIFYWLVLIFFLTYKFVLPFLDETKIDFPTKTGVSQPITV
jgi:hypothetical protein